jgi:CcmD family protein
VIQALLLQTAAPPSNLSFLLAAFLVTGVVFLGYIFFIFRRRQETENEIVRLISAAEKEEGAGKELP